MLVHWLERWDNSVSWDAHAWTIAGLGAHAGTIVGCGLWTVAGPCVLVFLLVCLSVCVSVGRLFAGPCVYLCLCLSSDLRYHFPRKKVSLSMKWVYIYIDL